MGIENCKLQIGGSDHETHERNMKTKELMKADFEACGLGGKAKWLWYFWTWRLVTWLGKKCGRPWWWNGGRRTDGDPTRCEACGLVWRVRDCVHTYAGACGDVEPVDECPRCGEQI